MLLADIAYLLAAPVALPLLALKSLRTGKYRGDWPARLGKGPALPPPAPNEKLILLHCVSVGELNSTTTLIQQLLAADANLHIAITTTTDTGTARAHKLYDHHPRVHLARFPFDFSFAVHRLFDRFRPDLIALVELETWPNFLTIAKKRGIPAVLINGRLSGRSFPRYQFIRPVMRSMLRKLTWVSAQDETYAARFRALGAKPENLSILPTLKYDNAQITQTIPGQEPLAAALGIAAGHQLIVAGSTGPGEEEYLLDAYQQLQPQFPNARLALVPRHPQVVPQVLAAIKKRNLTPIQRSQHPDASSLAPNPYPLSPSQVVVLDTMGELRKLYALAFAIFVGRSLIKKGGGGSDMIEAAALGRPICYGPYTQNFAEVVELFGCHNAAVTVRDTASLTAALAGWLSDPQAAQSQGRLAQDLIRQQQGSTKEYVERLLQTLRPAPRNAP